MLMIKHPNFIQHILYKKSLQLSGLKHIHFFLWAQKLMGKVFKHTNMYQ